MLTVLRFLNGFVFADGAFGQLLRLTILPTSPILGRVTQKSHIFLRVSLFLWRGGTIIANSYRKPDMFR
jgi:hypothetical protein